MKKNMLITGGSGLLALNWGQSSRDDFNVTLAIHHRKIQLSGTTSKYIPLESMDDLESGIEKINPEIVIHTAGLTNVELCETNPELAHHVNVELAENIAIVCAKLKIPLVHISTDHLFSGDIQMLDEDHQVEPQNVYAKTKAEAEVRVLDVYPESLVIRTNFYGWGASYRSSFSDMIINNLKKCKSFTLFDDVYYSPIYIGVLVEVVHELIELKATGVFNVVGDERLSKYEFGMKVAKIFGLDDVNIIKGNFDEQSNLIRRPNDMSLSNKKTCNYLGRMIGNVDEHLNMLYQQYETGLAQEIQSL
jgi:dTDP-4-dehydrorhamnose reductase